MKIQVTFRGIAHLYKAMNKRWTTEIDIPGNTVAHVIDTLTRAYGSVVPQALLDGQGEIDMEIRVFQNEQTFLEYGRRMETVLDDGDRLLFMGFGITTHTV